MVVDPGGFFLHFLESCWIQMKQIIHIEGTIIHECVGTIKYRVSEDIHKIIT